jgi:hypothetical protein
LGSDGYDNTSGQEYHAKGSRKQTTIKVKVKFSLEQAMKAYRGS